MPLVDKVKTMTNSLEDDEFADEDDNQGDVCSSLPIQEESSCSSNGNNRKTNVVKTIKLTPLKASVHKRNSINK